MIYIFQFAWYAKLEGYPTIKAVARLLMSVPATSVSSERLFSQATRIYSNKLRNRLSGERAEQLLLIQFSLKSLKLGPAVEAEENDEEKYELQEDLICLNEF